MALRTRFCISSVSTRSVFHTFPLSYSCMVEREREEREERGRRRRGERGEVRGRKRRRRERGKREEERGE